MSDLSGKTALVTGGGTGLGAALAEAYAEAGARVWIAGRNLATLKDVAARHDAVTPVTTDVTDEEAVRVLFDAIGTCDIVIANAGASASQPFSRTDLETWTAMIDVNLTGCFLTLREAARRLEDAQWGRLIAIASTAGLKGYPYVSAYSAAKHGVIGMVKSAALEMARTGVTVNALCPGFLDTEMTDRSIENIVKSTGRSAEEARTQLQKMSPQHRLIDPSEVVAAARWLTGPGSEGVTGQAISISGGEV